MNLTWHIVKKDLRAQQWPLLLWSLIIVSKLLVGVALLNVLAKTNLDWLTVSFSRMTMLSQVLAALEGVSFVLVAAIVHEDLLVGTTAFWRTRPISGARLLRAKLLGIGLAFGVLPVLVTLPWWLGCGYGLREIAWAAGETLVVQAAFVLAGLLWATVTDGFARFLMWTLATLFAFPSVAVMVGAYIATHADKPTADVLWTRTSIEVAIAVIAILAVTVHQFLTRHTWRSVALILSGAVLIICTGLWWPWDFELRSKFEAWEAGRFEHRWPVAAEPAGLKFIVETPILTARPSPRIKLNVAVEGLPAGQTLEPGSSSFTVRWPDGTEARGAGYFRNLVRFFPSTAQALGLPVEDGAKGNRQQLQLDLYPPSVRMERIQTEPPVFTTRVYCRVLKAVAVDKVAAEPGAPLKDGAVSERVAGVESVVGGLMVAVVRKVPAAWPGMDFGESWRVFSQYRLVNRARGEVVRARQLTATMARIATVSINLTLLGYDAPSPKPAMNPAEFAKADRAARLASVGAARAAQMAWMRDAELYREAYAEETRFLHEITIERFAPEPAQP